MTIVYEGSELVLHHHQGETDYVVVTFIGAHETTNALTTFFAKNVIVKNNITAYGVTVKSDFWYISKDSSTVISILQEKLSSYNNIILIGMSMGGYPALSWSRALGATTIFSMCPKYSLDPEECDILPSYVQGHFRQEMAGMAIKKENVSGRVFIALDLYEEHDKYHSGLIQDELKGLNVNIINVFFAGHLIIRNLSGSREFGSIIKALAYGSETEVINTTTRVRLKNRENISNKFRKYGREKPLLVFRALMGTSIARHRKCMRILSEKNTIMPVVRSLLYRGLTREAVSLHYNMVMSFSLKKNSNKFSCTSDMGFFEGSYIVDYHSRLLGFDIDKCSIVTCNDIFDVGKNYLILSEGRDGCLFIRVNSQKLYVCERGDSLYLSEYRDENVLRAMKREDFSYLNYVKTGRGYLISLPGGSVSLDSQNLKEWETFTCLPKAIPSDEQNNASDMGKRSVRKKNIGVKVVEKGVFFKPAYLSTLKKNIFTAIFQKK